MVNVPSGPELRRVSFPSFDPEFPEFINYNQRLRRAISRHALPEAKIAPMPKLKDMWKENGFLLERIEQGETRVWANFEGQDTDPTKRWERQAETLKSPWPTCGETMGEHTPETIRACAIKQRENR